MTQTAIAGQPGSIPTTTAPSAGTDPAAAGLAITLAPRAANAARLLASTMGFSETEIAGVVNSMLLGKANHGLPENRLALGASAHLAMAKTYALRLLIEEWRSRGGRHDNRSIAERELQDFGLELLLREFLDEVEKLCDEATKASGEPPLTGEGADPR